MPGVAEPGVSFDAKNNPERGVLPDTLSSAARNSTLRPFFHILVAPGISLWGPLAPQRVASEATPPTAGAGATGVTGSNPVAEIWLIARSSGWHCALVASIASSETAEGGIGSYAPSLPWREF